jgi:hypothetical protein
MDDPHLIQLKRCPENIVQDVKDIFLCELHLLLPYEFRELVEITVFLVFGDDRVLVMDLSLLSASDFVGLVPVIVEGGEVLGGRVDFPLNILMDLDFVFILDRSMLTILRMQFFIFYRRLV